MKQRIISGLIMGGVVALVLILGLGLKSFFITAFISVIAAIAVWEFICNAIGFKDILFQVLSVVYTAVVTPVLSAWLENTLRMAFIFNDAGSVIEIDPNEIYVPAIAAVITIVYFIACAVLILIRQQDFDLTKIFTLCTMPLFLAFAFSTIGSIITASGGIYYLLLVLNFSCVCDIGAYFVGVSMGKTKLCPAISPKKTVEGALGGIISSIIVSLLVTLCFGRFRAIIPTILVTTPLCAAGIVGDLFASVIKRKVGIKDYGNLIPGHGGILDRVDSVLFIAPLVYCFIFAGIL